MNTEQEKSQEIQGFPERRDLPETGPLYPADENGGMASFLLVQKEKL